MNQQRAISHKLRNRLQSLLLIAGMAGLLALCANLLLGGDAWIGVFVGLAASMLILPNVPPALILRLYRAQPVDASVSPQLTAIIQTLSQRANLKHPPRLHWLPSQTLNAFAVGSRRDSAIAITDGLLRLLSVRELTGVLAHEISHIRNNDLRIMTMADMITRMTHLLALTGIIAALIALPLMLFEAVSISLLGLMLLIVSPSINALLQLGLSRVREFHADTEAARLTRDPAGLASALSRIDQVQLNPWRRVLMPGYRDIQPSILRSHPHTHERVERLLQLRESERSPEQVWLDQYGDLPYRHIRVHRPRHRLWTGTWH